MQSVQVLRPKAEFTHKSYGDDLLPIYGGVADAKEALSIIQEFCKATVICQPVSFVYMMSGDIVYLGLKEL